MRISALVPFIAAAEALGSSSNPLLQAQKDLQRRALPPCDKCPSSDGDWLSTFSVEQVGVEDQSEVTSDDWYPVSCKTHGYVCIKLGPGINYSSGGISPYPFGHWTLPGGGQIYTWTYWQSTIQFTGPGVTFNIYPAHCTVWILAKGAKAKVIVGGQVVAAQGSDVCLGSYQDFDVGVINFVYAS